MELKYGQKSTYKFELDDEKLVELTNFTGRSKAQTQFLFNLVEGDWEKLLKLEMQIKKHHVYYCPDSNEEVNELLKMGEDK